MLIYAECVLAADWARGGPVEADLPDIAEAEASKSTLTNLFPVWVEHVPVDMSPTDQSSMSFICIETDAVIFQRSAGFVSVI